MPVTTVRLACGILLLLASGCAAMPMGDTERELQVRCERSGGRWHAYIGREGYCEYRSP